MEPRCVERQCVYRGDDGECTQNECVYWPWYDDED